MRLLPLALAAPPLLALLVPHATATPQIDEVWSHALPADSDTATIETLTASLALADGGVLVATHRRPAAGGRDHVLRRYDANGDLAWEVVGDPSFGGAPGGLPGYRTLHETSGGDILALRVKGQNHRVEWFGADGQLLSTAPGSRLVHPLPDGGHVAAHDNGVLQTVVRRYLRDGSLVWERGVDGTALYIRVDALGNTFLFGRNEEIQYTATPLMAGRISLDGVVHFTDSVTGNTFNGPAWFSDENVWHSFGTHANGIEIDARGHVFMLIGFGGPGAWRVAAFDRIGDLTWVHDHFVPGSTQSAWDLEVSGDGSVRVFGVDGGSHGPDVFVTRLDPDGVEMWTRAETAGTVRVRGAALDAEGRAILGVTRESATEDVFEAIVYSATGSRVGAARFPVPTSAPHVTGPASSVHADARGGVVIAHSTPIPGSASASDLHTTFGRFAIGGPTGSAICTFQQPTNSTGQSGRLTALGTDDRELNDLTLVADRLPSNATTLFITGDVFVTVLNPGGSQGRLCVGGAVGRYVRPGEVRRSDGAGRATLRLDLANTPSPTANVNVMAGETRFFQAWHRDANPTLTSNFTTGIAVTFR